MVTPCSHRLGGSSAELPEIALTRAIISFRLKFNSRAEEDVPCRQILLGMIPSVLPSAWANTTVSSSSWGCLNFGCLMAKLLLRAKNVAAAAERSSRSRGVSQRAVFGVCAGDYSLHLCGMTITIL
jgi:hypothetical protein